MDPSLMIMWLGFILAGYSVVGNDSIQTLGTFLSSNENRPWYVLWFFAGSILTITMVYGWYNYGGDVSYDRLAKYPLPDPFAWYYILPPLVLMALTRTGIPVSTSFLILTFFSEKNMMDMIEKSVLGYIVAFGASIVVYILIASTIEKRFIESESTPEERRIWMPLLLLSTGFLWSQWLIQDFANIFVYLPRSLSGANLAVSLSILLLLLGYIFYSKGGSIQNIVKSKTNTVDIRSATIVNAVYGLVLYYFKELNNVPMSTTWVFIGLLAGREIAIRIRLEKKISKTIARMVLSDLGKVFFGLVVSILLVFIIKFLAK
ncbi:MAG: hypothetical protein KDD19_08215 [Phaeodactylibacter sp.]|nr:hypothetical protein [Phaeodactylibacter sp.]MCB9051837.1 hypothetical protein [Lewinellaceae bacterium]